MRLTTKKAANVLHHIRRETFWLLYSKVGYLLLFLSAILSAAYAIHIVSSWNASVVAWNSNYTDASFGIEDIREALRNPLTIGREQDQIIIDNMLHYQTVNLFRAHAATLYETAIIGGLSFLTFTAFPILAVWIGIAFSGREYKAGSLLLKSHTASQKLKWGAKVLALFHTLLVFTLMTTILLPLFVELARATFAQNPHLVQPMGLFELAKVSNRSSGGYADLKGFLCAIFIMFTFSMIGLFLGEITKGSTTVFALSVGAYYLLPLGNYLDPRNLFAAVGKDVFWFGGSFNPYNASLDLLTPTKAMLAMLCSAMLFLLAAGILRMKRIENVSFLRKQA